MLWEIIKYMAQLILATTNAGKLREFQQILTGYELIPQTFESVPETGLTFVENAILKARHAASVTGLPMASANI